MYIRSLGIPRLGWIDDRLEMTKQLYRDCSFDLQFQSAMRAMAVVFIIHVKGGYFMGVSKNLFPDKMGCICSLGKNGGKVCLLGMCFTSWNVVLHWCLQDFISTHLEKMLGKYQLE